MIRTDNLHIEQFTPLTAPDAIKAELPLSDAAAATVIAGRAVTQAILAGDDPRQLLIAGPCSVHCAKDALEYARRLKALADEVADVFCVVMRVYFEKPRTTIGWKGLLYDPDLNNSYDIEKGIRLARRILLDINEMGLPAGTEILEPVVPQYITDLITWGAIGARTTESQTHRQMASGLSMPIGFKNSTDGTLRAALDAIKTALSAHAFIGVTGDGRVAIFRTSGNAFGHLILRGGANGPNYASEHIAFSRELLRKSGIQPSLIVDCSHGNSNKEHRRQMDVLRDVVRQVCTGETVIKGVMLESYLEGGRQEIPENLAAIKPGVSITDACLSWADTTASVRDAARELRATRRK